MMTFSRFLKPAALALLGLLALLVGGDALAATTAPGPGGGAAPVSLPWDGPLTTLRNNLTGPVATAIGVVAFLAAGAALVFGRDELGDVAKRILYVVLAIAMIVLGNNFLTALNLVQPAALI